MVSIRKISPAIARRMAISSQRLAGERPPAGIEGILNLVRELGCLQLDPISVVARTHLLVLFSRLGQYDPAHLDTLLWQERRLFEYWAHCASIVLTEDYPLFQPQMQRAQMSERMAHWAEENAALKAAILARLDAEGPLASSRFEDTAVNGWLSTGWTSGRNVARMLDFLWIGGRIMVAGRSGIQKLWDLSERCLPEWTPRQTMDERDVTYQAAQRALRALGVARQRHIEQHFIRHRYPGLKAVLADLEAEGRIVQVRIADEGGAWPGPWYVHTDQLPLLERLLNGHWQPRTVLLSPFDNLICDRARTEQLFSFRYRIEIYTPQAKRQYGYYVLPVLHGDRFIGRIDPVMNRKTKVLTINAIHTEPDAPLTTETSAALSGAINELAAFLGAQEVVYAGGTSQSHLAAG